MSLGIWELIKLLFGALAKYISYKFDPEMIKRQDAIDKTKAEKESYDEINKIIASGATVDLTYFVSEYLRRMRREEPDPASRRAADLLIGSLPQRRTEEERRADTSEGFDN